MFINFKIKQMNMVNEPYRNGVEHLKPTVIPAYDTQHPADEPPFYSKELLGLDHMGVLELELAVKGRVFDL